MNDNYCNNCGKQGHLYHQCKLPITSSGVIAFRNTDRGIEYLMICRKDTLGYIDFLRGKYSLYDPIYITNMVDQMTICEKQRIISHDFDTLWHELWGESDIIKYKNEENASRDKFNRLKEGYTLLGRGITLNIIIQNSTSCWTEPEWGFPKGRRNYQEKDYNCAVREFEEETGYSSQKLENINNIGSFEEIFTGSNYKSYKHKYYLAHMQYQYTLQPGRFHDNEVSQIKWLTIDECCSKIRNYNIEKIHVINNINRILSTYMLYKI